MDQAKELETMWKAMQEMRVALDVEQLTSRERHHQLESRHEQLEERVARLDAEIADIREDTNMQVDRIKDTFIDGRLMLRTIKHKCATLPETGSTTLVWPGRSMSLYGASTSRLAALYDLNESEILHCYPVDAHSTYTSDHASHAEPMDVEALRLQLKESNNQLLYNEVTAKRLGAILGFALITPFIIGDMEISAKEVAIKMCRLYTGTTVVLFSEQDGHIVATENRRPPYEHNWLAVSNKGATMHLDPTYLQFGSEGAAPWSFEQSLAAIAHTDCSATIG
eukprot:gene3659-13733_t